MTLIVLYTHCSCLKFDFLRIDFPFAKKLSDQPHDIFR